MWENTAAIHSILNEKNYKVKILISSILKKIEKYNFEKKNYVGKQRSNPQYFKTKKLQSKIFNQLNI
jgi:hypothetical protein